MVVCAKERPAKARAKTGRVADSIAKDGLSKLACGLTRIELMKGQRRRRQRETLLEYCRYVKEGVGDEEQELALALAVLH